MSLSPDFVSVVRECGERDAAILEPQQIDVFGIDGRRARRVAVEAVHVIGAGVELLFPERRAVLDVERGNDLCARFRVARREEQAISPNHGRAVADVGERLLPEKVGRFPFGGNAGVVALAGAVGAAEAVPVGGEAAARKDQPSAMSRE